ncbi:uncharacterized protein [Watersipora subatra]|uniref:uncharacterized protein isoform X2 n=1 Tax=Watersipora subatra TaxID=2589382 RepID=UPI00355C85F8
MDVTLDAFLSDFTNGKYFSLDQICNILKRHHGKEEYWIRKVSDHKEYNRRTAAYNRCSKFFVPVWAAAYDYKVNCGYILYPSALQPLHIVACRYPLYPYELQPLHKVLHKIDFKIKRDKTLERVLRVCLFPIAFAIDALHNSTNLREESYFHRDICIENVYIAKNKFLDGEAKLMLTENTRSVFQEDYFDSMKSNSKRMRPYFMHPDIDMTYPSYDKKYDWYSFGIYILEILYIAMFGTKQREAWQKDIERDGIPGVMEKLSELKQRLKGEDYNERVTMLNCCLALAKRCIEVDSAMARCREWPCSLHPEEAGQNKQYYCEYEVTEITAQLFVLYRDLLDIPPICITQSTKEKVCEACCLRKAVKIPLTSYWKGAVRRRRECENIPDMCSSRFCHTSYCASCYKNGERLFCPYHSAPASPILGPNTYALILYGKQFYKGNGTDACEKNAYLMLHCLMHHEVRGIPGKKDGTAKNGFWAPDATKDGSEWKKDWIEYNMVQEYTRFIRSGSGDKCSGSDCFGSCTHVMWIMDHCFPSTNSPCPSVTHEFDEECPTSLILHASGEAKIAIKTDAHGDSSDGNPKYCSDILNFLRGVLYESALLSSKEKEFAAIVHSKELEGRAFVLPNLRESLNESGGFKSFNFWTTPKSPTTFHIGFTNAAESQYAILPAVKEDRTVQLSHNSPTYDVGAVEKEVHDFNEKDGKDVADICLMTHATSDRSRYSLVYDSDLLTVLCATSKLQKVTTDDGKIQRYERPACNRIFYDRIHKPTMVDLLAYEVHLENPVSISLSIDKSLVESSLHLSSQRINKERPNILVYVVYHFYMRRKDISKKIYKKRQQAGKSEQPEDADVNDEVKVFTNFAEHLYKPKRQLENLFELEEKVWKQLAYEAGSWVDRKVFQIDSDIIPNAIRISWPEQEVSEQTETQQN